MTQYRWTALLASLFAAAFITCAPLTFAQENTENQVDTAQQDAQEKIEAAFDRITASIAELNRLRIALPGLEPGFRDLMQRRIDDKEEQVWLAVESVFGQVIDNEDATSTQRDQIVAWIEMLVPWLDGRLVRNNEEVTKGLGDLSGLPINEAATTAIEVSSRISDAVKGLGAYKDVMDSLQALDVDVSDMQQTLIGRVQNGAEMLAVAIELDTDSLNKLRYRLTLTPTDADLLTMVKIVTLRRTNYANDLSELSEIVNDLGLDADQYRSLVLQITGDATEILNPGVFRTLAGKWSRSAIDWVNQNGLGIVMQVLLFVLIIFVFRALSKLTRRWVEHGVKKLNLSFLLRNMIVASVANTVFVLGILIALSQVGISLGPVLAGLGVAGFIVGFALQDTLANFASGMMILIYRPYDVGDVITASGITGKVKDMSLVYTVVHTFDNQKMIVPNSRIWGDVIQNVTSQRIRRVDLVFGIAYSDDIDKAEKVLEKIVEDNEMTLDDPEPMIKLHTLNESSVDFVVRPWVKSADYWDVYWDITRAVKKRFDEEGISIPFPQRDVHHFYDEQPPANV